MDPITGKVLATIGYAVEVDAVNLRYSMESKPLRQRVPILSTACTYGAQRYWFGCPACGRRVAILYLRSQGFACRKCSSVAYASQSEDQAGRAWRKQRKAKARLGEDGQRPKWMHFATYVRLRQTIYECERLRVDALVAMAHRMGVGGLDPHSSQVK